MGGIGLVEWVLGCSEPAALTHNVTPERERPSTECMYYLPLPLGGALLMHVVRCVCVSPSVPSLYVRSAVCVFIYCILEQYSALFYLPFVF